MENSMISQELEVSLHLAFTEARQQRHEFIGVEELLLSLLDNPSAQSALSGCNLDIEVLRKSLSTYIKETSVVIDGDEEVDSEPTLGFQRIIQRAIMRLQIKSNASLLSMELRGVDVLLSIFSEKDSYAVRILQNLGVTRDNVTEFAIGLINTKPVFIPQEPEELIKESDTVYHLNFACTGSQINGLLAQLSAGELTKQALLDFFLLGHKQFGQK